MSAMPLIEPSPLERARAAVARGWRPFPVEYAGKRPAVGIKWGTATATEPTAATLEMWFGREPVNVGIAAKGSGLVILDEDVLGGMERLCDDYGQSTPETYRVSTAHGWHWYFAAPAGVEIGNAPGVLADYGFDVRGGRGDGGYVVGAGSVHPSGVRYTAEEPDAVAVPLPAWLSALLTPEEDIPRVSGQTGLIRAGDGQSGGDTRRYTMDQAVGWVERYAIGPLRTAVEHGDAASGRLSRNTALNQAAVVVGHFVPGFWDEDYAWSRLAEEAAALGMERGEATATIRSGMRAGMRDPYTLVDPADPFSSPSGTSAAPDADERWTAEGGDEIRAAIEGAETGPETAVGARRRDGVRFLYPGLEHAVIGETEGGKTWFLLACAADELVAGNRVVYVHFEEARASSTVRRLAHQFHVPTHRIVDDLVFIGAEHPVPPGRIDEICDERVPVLVVLDGQNEAMALHGQKINDPDGAADYRRRLVKPWTRYGAAVVSADHVVKDPNQNGHGYALGSVHKLNGISGAAFLVENREAFGIGMKGNSGVYVVKDRPGMLRNVATPTNVARKYHLAEMVIDDTGDRWELVLHAPNPDDGPDPEFESMREDRRQGELDDEVYAVAAELIGKGLDVSASLVSANVRRKKASVLEALHRLVATERLVNVSYGRAARYDLPSPPSVPGS